MLVLEGMINVLFKIVIINLGLLVLDNHILYQKLEY
jgi:hypothetical protein